MENFDIRQVNASDELRLALKPERFIPQSSSFMALPHKYDRQDKSGLWQFETLKTLGLAADSRLLELGPGGGRLAMHVIPYLNRGHYAGLDVSRQGLDWLWDLLPQVDRAREPSLFWGGDFNLEGLLPWKPDIIWAHSVFTHLYWNEIGQCLHEMRKIVASTGHFFATYFNTVDNMWTSQPYGKSGKKLTYGLKDPFHYRFDTLESLARQTGWHAVHEQTEKNHKGQTLIRFSPQ